MTSTAPGAYFRTPVTIETRTPAEFIANLPGSPANRPLLHQIEHEIACIERERTITRNQTLYADEIIMLEAYRSQVEQVISGGRR